MAKLSWRFRGTKLSANTELYTMHNSESFQDYLSTEPTIYYKWFYMQ